MPRYHNSPVPKFYPCGVCGDDVPSKALACPGCGADERTGLRGEVDDSAAPGIELEEDFSYDEFMKREFPNKIGVPAGLHWIWWVTGLILLAAFIFAAFKF